MKSVRYRPLSELLEKFPEAAENISADIRSSDISWGSEKQMTLADASYIHDIIEERITDVLDDIEENHEDANKELWEQGQKYLRVLAQLRAGQTLYYCMEE